MNASTTKKAPVLTGYVTIEHRGEGPVQVLGKNWTRDYNTALELAGRAGGVVAARGWVAQKLGHDPVDKLGLVLVEAKKEGGK